MDFRKIDNRHKALLGIAALLLVLAAALGLSLTQQDDPPGAETKVDLAAKQDEQTSDACASSATYDRLKEIAFEEAIRVRNADPANLDTLATHSVVRMENPVVKSSDKELNVTVCSGRFVLELPPGAERGFGGERRLSADIEYSAQSAADGSGLVYQIEGAEPIIYKLAAFDLKGESFQAPAPAAGADLAEADQPDASAAPPASQPERPQLAEAAPPPMVPKAAPRPTPAPRPEAEPEPEAEPSERPATASRGSARPSFNCRQAGSRSEQMVCSNRRLAGLDRTMSSQFYSALARADPETRRELRRSRDRFLAYRERCRSEACVADAYQGRMAEISDIVGD
jgi:hypothetical protein